MGIPFKHSRPIEVGGVTYRFLVRRYNLEPMLDCRAVTVQRVGVRGKPQGQILQAMIKSADWTRALLGGDVAVTPSHVAALIRYALATGWDPSSSGMFYPKGRALKVVGGYCEIVPDEVSEV